MAFDSRERINQLERQVAELRAELRRMDARTGNNPAPQVRIVAPFTEDAGDYPEEPARADMGAPFATYPIRFLEGGGCEGRMAKPQVAQATAFPRYCYGQQPGQRQPPEWIARDTPCLGFQDAGDWFIFPLLQPAVFGYARCQGGFITPAPFKECDYDGSNERGEPFNLSLPHKTDEYDDPTQINTESALIEFYTGDVIVYAWTGRHNAERVYVAGGRHTAFYVKAQDDPTGYNLEPVVAVKLCTQSGDEWGETFQCNLARPEDHAAYVIKGDVLIAKWHGGSAPVPPSLDRRPRAVAWGYHLFQPQGLMYTFKQVGANVTNQAEFQARFPRLTKIGFHFLAEDTVGPFSTPVFYCYRP